MSFQSVLADAALVPNRSWRPLSWLAASLARVRGRLRQTADFLYATRELESLSDRELADIGLNRGQIRGAVQSGRA